MQKKTIGFLFFLVSIIFLGFGFVIFYMFWSQVGDLQSRVMDLQEDNIDLKTKTEELSSKDIELKIVSVVNKVKNSVAIVSSYKTTDYLIENIDLLGTAIAKEYKINLAGATAFVVHPQGYLITSKHVVEDIDAEYEILLNGKKYFLNKRWFFDNLDLALIRVKDENEDIPLDFIPLILNNGINNVFVGQSVISLGNLTAQDNIGMMSAIVGAIGEDFKDNQNYLHYGSYVIGTSFPSGFSGGPLLDLDGNVIGINTAVSREGFSYALPVNQKLLQKFFDELVENKVN